MWCVSDLIMVIMPLERSTSYFDTTVAWIYLMSLPWIKNIACSVLLSHNFSLLEVEKSGITSYPVLRGFRVERGIRTFCLHIRFKCKTFQKLPSSRHQHRQQCLFPYPQPIFCWGRRTLTTRVGQTLADLIVTILITDWLCESHL